MMIFAIKFGARVSMTKWFGGLFVVSAIPIVFYFYTFGLGLWERNEDWAYLGSFFGGVLGPAFTLMSVVLLVLTLRETRGSNKLQLELADKQYFDNYFYNSLTAIKLSLESIKYGRPIRVGDHYGNFFAEASVWVVDNFIIHQHTDYNEDAWETAKAFIQHHDSLFDSEIALLVPLLLKIKSRSENEQQRYLTLINGFIDNDKRFWLEVYGMVWSTELGFTLKGINFSSLPRCIQDKVLEIESQGLET